jgi:hypothetical protein
MNLAKNAGHFLHRTIITLTTKSAQKCGGTQFANEHSLHGPHIGPQTITRGAHFYAHF